MYLVLGDVLINVASPASQLPSPGTKCIRACLALGGLFYLTTSSRRFLTFLLETFHCRLKRRVAKTPGISRKQVPW